MPSKSQIPGYFDALYADNPDPWGFETSDYERAKYDATLAALPRSSFAAALEVGCSIGVLTERLAPRCATLLATDVADAALDQARVRCRHLPHVSFARSDLPHRAPDGSFDLILLSEVLYYFGRTELVRIATQLTAAAAPGAAMLLVHWLGPTPDYPLTGDEAVAAFEAALSGFSVRRRERTEQFRLDLLEVARSD
jgi:trans-aconitate methyltransferase